MPLFKGKQEIGSLADWMRLAGPKRSDQWVPDRSAMEVARAWLHDGGKTFPSAVVRILEGHPDFGAVLDWWAEPEAKLPFDTFPGEPRNTDLLVVPRDRFGSYVLAVESKADETFGETVSDTMAEALERKLANARSNGLTRIEQLGAAILGGRFDGASKVGDLRYQLLTATAGAVCEAQRRGTDRAVLLVHEFITRKTIDGKHQRNAEDLDRFLHRVSGGACRAIGSSLVGPFQLPGDPLFREGIRLYVGKIATDLRS
jgi:hypothetical protein